MLDFKKINAIINELNNIVVDLDNETTNINNELHNTTVTIYNYVCEKLVEYCDVLNNACGNCSSGIYRNIKASFEIPLRNPKGKINFVYGNPTYSFDVKVLAGGDDDRMWDGYEIIHTNRGGYVNVKDYEEINRSHSSIKWFLRICNDWNCYKSEIEDAVANAVSDILRQKIQIAYNDNINAKTDLQLIKSRGKEIYDEFDNS